jgi:carbonic anhydrase
MPSPISKAHLFIFFISLSLAPLSVANAAEATFSNWGAVDGPLVWHKVTQDWKLCARGSEQSPINICRGDTPPGKVLLDYPPKGSFLVKNTDHSIQLDPKNPELFKASMGGKKYKLLQFHFHTPSEHFLDGEHFPIEIHFVHEQVDSIFSPTHCILLFVSLTFGNRARRHRGYWNLC